MAKEWRRRRLRDLCESISYGLTASASSIPTVGPKFLRITDIVRGSIDWAAVPHVVASDSERAKYKLRNGDIVIARTGATTGYSACIADSPEAVFASYLVRFAISKEHNPRFVAYALESSEWWRYIHSVLGDKSAQPNASANTLADAWLSIPDRAMQDAIAKVLGALDDKIDCNRSLVALAEGLAVSLFADAANRADDRESRVCRLSELVDHLPGKYLPRKRYLKGGAYTVYGSNSVMGCHSEYLYEGPFTVMARIGSNCGVLMWSQGPAWVNNNASALRAKPEVDPWFLHRLLQTVDMDPHRAGSGQPFVRIDSLLATFVTVPQAQRMSLIGGKLRALAERGEAADMESKKLGTLRDVLLPPLLSGELQLRDVEPLMCGAI